MVGKGARFLAPIALVAVSVGVYLLVHSAFAHHTMTTTPTTATIVNNQRGHPASRPHRVKRFYTVRPGDTLSEIADRTGVSAADITTLNPSLANAPNSLQPGQRLRLRH